MYAKQLPAPRPVACRNRPGEGVECGYNRCFVGEVGGEGEGTRKCRKRVRMLTREAIDGDGNHKPAHCLVGQERSGDTLQVVRQGNKEESRDVVRRNGRKGNVRRRKNKTKRRSEDVDLEGVLCRENGDKLLEESCDVSGAFDVCKMCGVGAICLCKHPQRGKLRAASSGCEIDSNAKRKAVVQSMCDKMADTDPRVLVFAWYLASSEYYGRDTWKAMMQILSVPDAAEWNMIALLYEVNMSEDISSCYFRYDCTTDWDEDCISSCFSREIEYTKFRKLLCDNVDERALAVLLDGNAKFEDFMCLSLGCVESVERCIALKETLKLLQLIGLVQSIRMIVHKDEHDSTSVTLVTSRRQIDEVQGGLLSQLDMQGRVAHKCNTMRQIAEVFDPTRDFCWRRLSAFAILLARCCGGDDLFNSRICSVAPLPYNYSLDSEAILQALGAAINSGKYVTDTIQACAGILLDIGPNGSLMSIHSRDKACDVLSFLRILEMREFRDARAPSAPTRWLTMVRCQLPQALPIGSEHAFMCCLADFTFTTSATLTHKRIDFISMDQQLMLRLSKSDLISPLNAPFTPLSSYDPTMFIDALNSPKSTVPSGWHTIGRQTFTPKQLAGSFKMRLKQYA
jgi:hypothetical protein